jgi:hypothetical protein
MAAPGVVVVVPAVDALEGEFSPGLPGVDVMVVMRVLVPPLLGTTIDTLVMVTGRFDVVAVCVGGRFAVEDGGTSWEEDDSGMMVGCVSVVGRMVGRPEESCEESVGEGD